MLGEVTPGHERTLYGTSEVNGMGGTCTPSRTNKVDCQAVCIGEGTDAPCGRNGSMPRQRINHSRRTKAFPEGFSERLKRFHEEIGPVDVGEMPAACGILPAHRMALG